MAFALATPFPIRTYIAPGANPGTDQTGWLWQEITPDVRVRDGITIEAGRGDEAARVDPGRCTLTIDNTSGDYSPRNPLGQWFGTLRKNTPLRVSVGGLGDTFDRTVANGWGTSSGGLIWSAVSGLGGVIAPANLSVTSNQGRITVPTAVGYRVVYLYGMNLRDADVTMTVTVPGVVTVTGAALEPGNIAFRTDVNGYQYLARFAVSPAGVVTAYLFDRSGATLASAVVPALTWTGQAIKMRARISGSWFGVRVWAASGSEPTTWHATSTAATDDTPGPIGIRAGAAAGNTNVPVTVAYDDLTIDADQFLGTVPEWPVRWGDKSGVNAMTPIVASGVLRRLQQGQSALRSPIARNFGRFAPVAYWRLEDASGATRASNSVVGAPSAYMKDVTFAGDSTLVGSADVVGLTAASYGFGKVPSHTITSSWSMVFYVRAPAAPAADTVLLSMASSGTVRRWDVVMGPASYDLYGYDEDNVKIIDTGGAFTPTDTPGLWVAFDLLVEQIGGNVKGTLLSHGIGRDHPFYFVTDTVAGTIGRPTQWTLRGSAGLDGGAMGHIFVINGPAPFVSGDFVNASYGYTGETAAARIARLCAEEGVLVIVGAGESSPMGAQKIGTFLELLQDAEDADLGVLRERAAQLAYTPRGGRYNPLVTLALDFDQGHVSEPPEPTDDDQRVRNDVTVNRTGGSSFRAADQAHIDAQGRYDEAVTINVETDDVLDDHAGWRLRIGTLDALRWPRIDMNLAARQALIPSWLGCDVGSRVTVANPPLQTPEPIDVIVEGYTQKLSQYGWDVTINASPATIWDVAVEGAARADVEACQLAAAIVSTSAVSITTTTTSGPLWTTNPVEMPFPILVGGEEMSVTAVVGTVNPQTLAVTRAVNGISKTHVIATDVRLADPAYAAL
jgi:hypothetical protein